MSSIPLMVNPPVPPNNPIEQYGQALTLQNLIQGIRQRQQLMPGQLQAQQNELQRQQQENQSGAVDLQLKQIGLKNAQTVQSALSDPKFGDYLDQAKSQNDSGTAAAAGGGSTVPLHPIAQVLASKYGLPLLGQNGALDISKQFTTAAQEQSTLLKTQGDAAQTNLKNNADKLNNFDDLVEPVLAEKDPTAQQQGLAHVQSEIQQNPQLYPDEALKHISELGTIQGLQGAANTSKVRQMLIEDATKQAGLKEAQEKGDVVAQLGTPQALADPGAQAAIQAKINDPTTDPKDVPRLQALIPRAALAQQNALRQKAREQATQQAITQGDPNAAGQLLANRSLTLQELKTRGATPQFIASAVKAAQQIDPNFKAADSEAQSKIAASPTNQQFFGNTDSLLVRGGTLDQLDQAGQALGNTRIPAYNTLANWTKAALGSGPQAAYAAKVLGVADDYAKVMGGGVGSDTGRQQAIDIISKNLSPEGRKQGIQAIRETVASQREGRIGSNPYMRDMYPDPSGARAKEPPAQNLPKPAAGMTRIQASDGSIHDIPTNNIFRARQRDPGLQVVQ